MGRGSAISEEEEANDANVNSGPLAYGGASLRIEYPLVCRATFAPGESLPLFTELPPVAGALVVGGG